jgi:hypothetical protein
MKNIHFIPTDKPTRLYLSNYDKELNLSSYPLRNYTTGQHIYITNDEEIEEGDWFYDLDTKYVKIKQSWENSHLEFNGKKIILTTDEDLINEGVQAIDEDFLQWLVKNPNFENVVVKNFEDQYVYNFLDYEIIDETDHLLSQEANKKRLLQDTKEQKQHLIDMMKGDEELGLYEETTKCYCGHTTYCDCGPEEPKQEITLEEVFNEEKVKGVRELIDKPKQETLEEAIKRLCVFKVSKVNDEMRSVNFEIGAKWQQERMYSKEDLEVAFFEGQFGRYSFIDWLEQFKKK